MSRTTIFLVFLLVALAGFYAAGRFSLKDDRVLVEAYDGRHYLVRDIPQKAETANMMAKMNEKVNILFKNLREGNEKAVMVARLTSRFRPEVLSEGRLEKKLTSYTVNKGEKLVMCMRKRDGTDALFPENVLFSVLLHELAHIASLSEGHGKEFQENLAFLTGKAQKLGLQRKEQVNLDYCGIPLAEV